MIRLGILRSGWPTRYANRDLPAATPAINAGTWCNLAALSEFAPEFPNGAQRSVDCRAAVADSNRIATGTTSARDR
jgi:hypothetical protein